MGHGGVRIVFSGDLGPRGAPLHRDPTPFRHADVVFMESTYGDRDHRSLAETAVEAREAVRKCIEQNGRVLVPVFAIGRTQLLLLLAYPVLTLPIAIAHLARWATGSYWSYHGVLAICLIVGLCFYYAATEAAEEFADSRKERIVAILSRQDGPVSIST